ncbi:hypothetical protein [Nocardiopsis coralliicola]
MAHHYPDLAEDDGPPLPLPRTLRGRALAVAAVAVLAAVLAAAVWAGGGFQDAERTMLTTVDPGKTVRTPMMAAAVHSASAGRDPDTGGFVLRVRADVEILADAPVGSDEISRVVKPRFGRDDLRAETMSIVLPRHPEGTVSELQPRAGEEVELVWMLAEGDPTDTAPKSSAEIFGEDLFAEPDDVSEQLAAVDAVELTLTGASYDPGFTDPARSWGDDGSTAGVVTLPLEED